MFSKARTSIKQTCSVVVPRWRLSLGISRLPSDDGEANCGTVIVVLDIPICMYRDVRTQLVQSANTGTGRDKTP